MRFRALGLSGLWVSGRKAQARRCRADTLGFTASGDVLNLDC